MKKLPFLREMFELLDEDLVQTQFREKKYNGRLKYSYKPTRVNHPSPEDNEHDKLNRKGVIGRGLFSTVSSDPSDPHVVKKVNSIPLGPDHAYKADGFDQYVKMMVEMGAMDNIHFPKIYTASKTTDATGTHRNEYSLERLGDLESLPPEEFEALAERCFLRLVSTTDAFADRIEGSCESAYERREYIRMESLVEACAIIEEMKRQSDFNLDIHAGNLLVRRTPHGLQLVIADPFGLLKASAKHKYS